MEINIEPKKKTEKKEVKPKKKSALEKIIEDEGFEGELTQEKLLEMMESYVRKAPHTRDKLSGIITLMKWKIKKSVGEERERSVVIREEIDDEKLQNAIGWSPEKPKKHKEQIKILKKYNSIEVGDIVIDAGRRGGKSAICAYMALKELLKRNRQILMVAPTYDLTQRVLDYLIMWSEMAFPNEIKFKAKPFPHIITSWGARMDCKSAEQPHGMLGKGYDVIIVDECSRIKREVHDIYIVPASGKKRGLYIFLSTPFGKNWFWQKWLDAKPKGLAFQFESRANPYFEKKKWDEAKRKLPERIFKQEYMAHFLDDGAGVFQMKHIEKCKRGVLEKYNPKHLYLMGVDLGRYQDWTVAVVIDRMTNHVVAIERFQGDWELQKKRIEAKAKAYGDCPVFIDSTSVTVGDAYVRELSDKGVNTIGYKIHSNMPKRQLVEKASVLIQEAQVTFPDPKDNPEIEPLVNEMEAFTFKLTPSGNIVYQHPEGYHDDAVIAFCLAVWDLDEKPLKEQKEGEKGVMLFPEQEF